MKDQKFTEILKQSLKRVRLNLAEKTLLLPEFTPDPSIMPLMAGLSGAATVFVTSRNVEVINKIKRIAEELKLNTKYHFIESETDEIIPNIDILVKGKGVSTIGANYVAKLNQSCVISICPKDLDFTAIEDIDIDYCTGRKIPVIMFDPADSKIELYKYYAHLILKRLYESGLDAFRSKTLIIGNDGLLQNAISVLKASGVNIYAVDTEKQPQKDYITKHLQGLDAIVVADTNQKIQNIISTEPSALIEVVDIATSCPEVQIIHLCGDIDLRAINFSSIKCNPANFKPQKMNISLNDFKEGFWADLAVGVLSCAGFVAMENQAHWQIVSYKILNKRS